MEGELSLRSIILSALIDNPLLEASERIDFFRSFPNYRRQLSTSIAEDGSRESKNCSSQGYGTNTNLALLTRS